MQSKLKNGLGFAQTMAAVPSVMKITFPPSMAPWVTVLEWPQAYHFNPPPPSAHPPLHTFHLYPLPLHRTPAPHLPLHPHPPSLPLQKLGLDLVLPSACYGSFRKRMLINSLWPFALMLLAVCGCMTRDLWKSPTRSAQGVAHAARAGLRRALPVLLVMTFVLLPAVSTKIFRAFLCITVGEDDETFETQRFLLEDMALSCDSALYAALRRDALVMVFVWPVGVPCLYAILLWINRKVRFCSRYSPACPHAIPQPNTTQPNLHPTHPLCPTPVDPHSPSIDQSKPKLKPTPKPSPNPNPNPKHTHTRITPTNNSPPVHPFGQAQEDRYRPQVSHF